MNKTIITKILIVEDEVSLLSSLKDKFESEGFKVITAMDGEEGLAVTRKENPDLILIDILLPKLDGISMAQEISKLGFDMPMIFLTNVNDVEHISKAMIENTTDYLVKSDWSINDVVARVKERLKTK
jgi:DNA-binding response OmpR family regulator